MKVSKPTSPSVVTSATTVEPSSLKPVIVTAVAKGPKPKNRSSPRSSDRRSKGLSSTDCNEGLHIPHFERKAVPLLGTPPESSTMTDPGSGSALKTIPVSV